MHNAKHCEDEDDAARMLESALRALGYTSLQRGHNVYAITEFLSDNELRNIAQHAERVARWARRELKTRG